MWSGVSINVCKNIFDDAFLMFILHHCCKGWWCSCTGNQTTCGYAKSRIANSEKNDFVSHNEKNDYAVYNYCQAGVSSFIERKIM